MIRNSKYGQNCRNLLHQSDRECEVWNGQGVLRKFKGTLSFKKPERHKPQVNGKEERHSSLIGLGIVTSSRLPRYQLRHEA